MAFGFSPRYIQEYGFGDQDREHFLVLAVDAASNLGWDVSFISEHGFIAYTKFSWRSPGEEVRVKVSDGIATVKSTCTGNQLIDWGKNRKNTERFLAAIEDAKMELTEEALASKLDELHRRYVPEEDNILNMPPSTAKEKITGFFSIFRPTEGYFVTPILISLNILIFIIMVISGVHILLPEIENLLNWGANFRPLTLQGQWWRLLTSCFLHIGVFHLLLNMYALLYIGVLLEPYLGKTRFLAAYLLTGFAASMTSLYWNDLTVSAGASGAIFGMYGVFLALLTTNLLDQAAKKSLLTSIVVFVGYNLMHGFRANSGMDNAAHIGGLLSGLVIGYAYVPSLREHHNRTIQFSIISALTTVLLIISFSVYRVLPNDLSTYQKKMEEFASMESMALEVYRLSDETPESDILSELENRGLYYWQENLNLVRDLKKLDLPMRLQAKNKKLQEYCELRIKSYKLIYKAIDEHTDQYQPEIGEYNRKIEAIIKELTGK